MTATHRHRGLPWFPILIGVCVILAGASLYLYGRTEGQRATVATSQARQLSDPILELCIQGGNVARALATEGKCALAEQVRSVDTPEPLPQGPDRAEVARLIQAEVAKITLPPGQGPTSGQLQEAAERVILAHPELFRGPQGDPPTDVAIAAAVNAWFEENADKLPPGKPGADGKDGPAGADGGPGEKGDVGDPGQPPTGWTTIYPDGARQSCERADGFNPDAPRYRCTHTPAPPPPTTAQAPPPATTEPPLLPG